MGEFTHKFVANLATVLELLGVVQPVFVHESSSSLQSQHLNTFHDSHDIGRLTASPNCALSKAVAKSRGTGPLLWMAL